MTTTINGSSPSVTFSDGTTQTTAGLTGSATQLCKAWINFNGTTTPTINSSYNVSSITYISAGVFTVTFTTPFANTNYTPIIGNAFASGVTESISGVVYNDSPNAPTTSVLTVAWHNTATAARLNPTFGYVAVFSS
jgi:hypothetical protein